MRRTSGSSSSTCRSDSRRRAGRSSRSESSHDLLEKPDNHRLTSQQWSNHSTEESRCAQQEYVSLCTASSSCWSRSLQAAGATTTGRELEPPEATLREAGSGGPLVVNIAQAPATLDPAWGCGLYDIGFLQNFYVRLTQYGSEPGPEGTTQFNPGDIQPYFAENIDISPDGLVYTFTLPAGVTFPSGEPVDSEAVKYSLERSIEMAGCGGYFIYDGIYEPPLVKSIETPDPTTVVITLSVPNANFLQDLAQPAASIVDASVVEANGGITAGEINEYMSSNVAGSGPFLLEEYEPNKRAVLKANPDFFGDPPAVGGDHRQLHQRGRDAPATGALRPGGHHARDDQAVREQPRRGLMLQGDRERQADLLGDHRNALEEGAVGQREVPRGGHARSAVRRDHREGRLWLGGALLWAVCARDERIQRRDRSAA